MNAKIEFNNRELSLLIKTEIFTKLYKIDPKYLSELFSSLKAVLYQNKPEGNFIKRTKTPNRFIIIFPKTGEGYYTLRDEIAKLHSDIDKFYRYSNANR